MKQERKNYLTEEIKQHDVTTELFRRYHIYDDGDKYGIQHMGRNLEIFFKEDDHRNIQMNINGVKFYELTEIQVREKEPLARTTTSINMNG